MSDTFTRRTALARGGQAALALSAAGGLIAGCGPTSGEEAAPGPKKGTKGDASGEFTFWYTTVSAREKTYTANDLVGTFEKQYPKIKIDLVYKNSETIARLTRTALQAQRGPDLITSSGAADAAAYADARFLLPLDEYAKAYGWDKKILPWALDTGRFAGKLYVVPEDYETLLIYYNKTLFEEKGWKPPTNRAELEALATEIEGDGILPFMAGNADWRPATEWFVTVFLNSFAGPKPVSEALKGERKWTDPVFVEAISLMNDYFQRGWFGGSVRRYFTNRFNPQYAQMADKKIAMDMEGSWAFPQLNDFFDKSDSEYDWFAVPNLSDEAPAGTFPLAIGSTLAINANAKSPDAVAQYLNWLYSDPKRTAAGVAKADVAPLPVNLEESDFPRNVDPRQARLYAGLNEATERGAVGYATWAFWPPRSNSYLYEEMEKVLVGDVTPQEWAQGLDDIFKGELKKGLVPKAFEPTA